MTKKPQSRAWDDPEESKRFLDEAKAAEASDDPKELDRVLRTVATKKV